MTQLDRDVMIARDMLSRGPQSSLDLDADAEFAERVHGLVTSAAQEVRLHRRRIAALRELVKRGEARSFWLGVGFTEYAGAPHRGREYEATTSQPA